MPAGVPLDRHAPSPPASVTSSAPGSQSHGSVCRLDPRVEAAGGDPGELERARAGVAEQPGAVEEGVAVRAHAGQDEPVLAQEDRDVGRVERPRRCVTRERLAVAAWRPAPRAAA